jgi:hypothetical protein
MMINAKERGVREVYEAAFRKLVSIMPGERPGTLEYELWRSIHALESVLTEEHGKTTRLGRTRQKIARVGVRQVLVDFANHPTSTPGFDMLIERGMPELTGEAIVLRHPHEFPPTVVEAAKHRLELVGVDTDKLSAQRGATDAKQPD